MTCDTRPPERPDLHALARDPNVTDEQIAAVVRGALNAPDQWLADEIVKAVKARRP